MTDARRATGPGGTPIHTYDVFLSLGGPDRLDVRILVAELRRIGLTVFLDEESIRLFTGITSEIEQALRGSRILVAYYSADYPHRTACQFELTSVYLAAQREGDPTRRIVVVNPERSEEHIRPVELLDAKFALQPGDKAGVEALARAIKQRVEQVDRPVGAIRFTDRPRWFTARVPGTAGFVGRYPDLWELHSVLASSDYPLTQAAECGPVVNLTGLAGIGKSALAAAYAWQFGAAFLGGVFWLDLAGGGSREDVLARYADRVSTLAQGAGLSTEGVSRARLFGMVGDYLAGLAEPSLWIVDNVPHELGADLVHELLMPGGDKVRTVLISGQDRFRSLIPVVELGPLSGEDARAVLSSYREPDGQAEVQALEALAERLGRHPGALQLAGTYLRPRRDLVSYADYVARLEADARSSTVYGALVREAVGNLDDTQRLLLRIAGRCGPGPIPAVLLARLFAARAAGPMSDSEQADHDPDAVGTALADLRERLLAAEDEGQWSIPPVVRIAAADLDPERDAEWPSPELIADQVLHLLEGRYSPAAEQELIGQAQALVGSKGLAPDRVRSLLRRIAAHYESAGQVAYAAHRRERVLAGEPDSVPDLLAAASDHYGAGELDQAVGVATRAGRLATAAGDTLSAFRADLILAQSLDGLSRLAEADEAWRSVESALSGGGPVTAGLSAAERLAARVARVHALGVRSELKRAISQVEALVDDLSDVGRQRDPVVEELQQAKVELAWLRSLIGQDPEARILAGQVVEFYHAKGADQHFRLLQAEEILAEANLSLQMREWKLDDTARAHAEATLFRLWQESSSAHGENSPYALSAAVRYGYALISQSKPAPARDHLTTIRAATRSRFGERHPLYLRSTFLLGWAYGGLKQDEKALEMYRAAFEGQRAVLGPAHPHTLRSQYELSVSLLVQGHTDEGRKILAEVHGLVPKNIGYADHFRAQTDVAIVLADLLPSPLWKLFRRFS